MTTHDALMKRFRRRGVTPEQSVTRAEAERRILDRLDPTRGTRLSDVADAIWPGHTMKAQGAALAAGRIVGRMQDRGLVGYAGNGTGWVRKN